MFILATHNTTEAVKNHANTVLDHGSRPPAQDNRFRSRREEKPTTKNIKSKFGSSQST
jgi:hypothetical protein